MMLFQLAMVSPHAEHVFENIFGRLFGQDWFTNSTLYSVIVVGLIIAFVRISLSKVRLVPSGLQNFCEWIVESLYGLLESIVGKHMIAKTFPLLCSLFVFILVANLSGLLPGVGTVGWGPSGTSFFMTDVERPILRPANADLNMTMSMALMMGVIWLYWTIAEVGVWGFIKELFGPKTLMPTDSPAMLKKIGAKLFNGILVLMFLFVGLTEIVSILSRAISLPVRLFGNIFGGENLLHTMGTIAGPYWAIPLSIPFYFLETLVAFLQALVFMLLCAVYIKLSTSHHESEEKAH